MAGPYRNFPLTQREFHEQAAAIAYTPPPPPAQPAPPGLNPFTRNPLLVKEEREH